ncbi:MAG: DUF4145 domain-containing protein [Candidatus Omnitrophica bacterium]|nr:DUF4145 domain-containing protein [Candidatus Omnitrophota bacterium]
MAIFTDALAWHCPYCKRHTQFNRKFLEAYNYSSGEGKPWQRADMRLYACVMCHEPVLFRVVGESDRGEIPDDRITVYPRTIPEAPEDIPNPIRAIFLEALYCASVQAWNATAAMCRRAVQECVIAKGGKGVDLYHQIEDLEQKRAIPEDLKDWAHEVRVIGKVGAHADVPMDITPSDAEDALKFTEEMLNYVYVLKGRLQKRQRNLVPS